MKTEVIVLDKGFEKHFWVAIINLAFVELLCSLGSQSRLYSSAFLEICFWTEDWVSLTKGHIPCTLGYMGALWVLHYESWSLVAEIFGHLKSCRWNLCHFNNLRSLKELICEAIHSPGFFSPGGFLAKKDMQDTTKIQITDLLNWRFSIVPSTV